MGNKLLENLLAYIQIPDSAYEQAKERYDSISDWFGREASCLIKYEPQVQPQGSFRLGTSIYPQKRDAEFDLDLTSVFQKNISVSSCTQKRLRDLVHSELEKYASKNQMEQVEEKKRCCRLNYKSSGVSFSSFHIDIVPAIPALQSIRESFSLVKEVGPEKAIHVIQITDNTRRNYDQISDDWLVSNPEGYAKWFEERMEGKNKFLLSESLQKVPIPTWKKKSCLQNIVQLLKWHRDVMFVNNPKSKPISVIITTLAAMAYDGQEDLDSGIMEVLQKMDCFIGQKAPYVVNPVNSNEDFGDKWDNCDYRQYHLKESYLRWIQQASEDFASIISSETSSQDKRNILNECFNYKNLDTVLDNEDPRFVLINAPHRQKITDCWQLELNENYSVEIEGSRERKGFRYLPQSGGFSCPLNPDSPIEKGVNLRFKAKVSGVPKPYEVWWQVGNTGEEALNNNCLRGGFYDSEDNSDTASFERGKTIRKEYTKYTGRHWVQCVIIQNCVCVARSRDFIVRIV